MPKMQITLPQWAIDLAITMAATQPPDVSSGTAVPVTPEDLVAARVLPWFEVVRAQRRQDRALARDAAFVALSPTDQKAALAALKMDPDTAETVT